MKSNQQKSIFKGIYEFEDPSGGLIAAKIPHTGSADLYSGTAVIVRPSQQAMLIYKGQITDLLNEGLHEVKTQNLPIITRLTKWSFGFRSPLRCELWFFATQLFAGRRWGTSSPVLHRFKDASEPIPLRAFGNFNVRVSDIRKFYSGLVGARSTYHISDLEEFVQGQIVEVFSEATTQLTQLSELSKSHDGVSQKLQTRVNAVLAPYGITLEHLQVLSILPSQEVLKAMDAKAAMQVIGNKQEYLLYQAANSLNELKAGGSNHANDPMQMMMGLMLGKSLITADYREKEREASGRSIPPPSRGGHERYCSACGGELQMSARFCSSCGRKV